jgi:hypothetical protein
MVREISGTSLQAYTLESYLKRYGMNVYQSEKPQIF